MTSSATKRSPTPEARREADQADRGGASGPDVLPSIMTGDEVDQAAENRRDEPYNPYRRKERPDPWPIVARGFPRIAAKIRELWGTPALDEYFATLVVDERGSRQGFPPHALSAILEIGRLHSARYRFARPMCPWEADVSQTKWWARRS